MGKGSYTLYEKLSFLIGPEIRRNAQFQRVYGMSLIR